MSSNSILFVLICTLLFSFIGNEKPLFKKPTGWPEPVYHFIKNPLKRETIELGRALFYDPILSRNQTISCQSCHLSFTAFTHVDHQLSHGIDDRIGTRNSPALMNLAWSKFFMWDGAINHLDMQALAPISHRDEMDERIENVVVKLQKSSIYPPLFEKSFGDRIITGERTLKAISQFLLTLVSSNSKYDSVIRKEKVFTLKEQNGYALFRKNCNTCHTEPLFSNFSLENNGLPKDKELNDIGRMSITRNPADSLRFKVPTLRNVEFSFPYMHDGRFKKLNQVINHYTAGIQKGPTLSKELEKPIILSSNDKVDLVAFLLTLSDKTFLFDPAFSFPKQNLSNQ